MNAIAADEERRLETCERAGLRVAAKRLAATRSPARSQPTCSRFWRWAWVVVVRHCWDARGGGSVGRDAQPSAFAADVFALLALGVGGGRAGVAHPGARLPRRRP